MSLRISEYTAAFLVHNASTDSFLSVELPVLDNEMYHAVKPGLSHYKDNPEEVCAHFYTIT